MKTEIIEYSDFNLIPDDEKTLIAKAEEATKNAYAPYSRFKVGAAVLLDDGSIILGANQENAAFPSGLCAERVALFNIMNSHPTSKVKKIAITAQKGSTDHFLAAAPCGGCRQVMFEQEQIQEDKIEVLFKDKQNWIKIHGINTILPFSFDKNALK